MSRLRFATLLVATLFAAPAHAGLVLDDFDDSAQVVSPEMEFEYVITPNVGPFLAERSMNIGSRPSAPIASLDANVTAPSQLTAKVDGITDIRDEALLMGFVVGYGFSSPVDFTQGGQYDAVRIDISRMVSNTPFGGSPRFIRPGVRTGTGVFFRSISYPSPTETGYSLTFPFAEFSSRGGDLGIVDFTDIEVFGVEFRLTQGYRDPEQMWLVQVDRISLVSTTVPEPACMLLLGLGLCFASHNRFHIRQNEQ